MERTNEKVGENVLVSQNAIRPRDLRPSKQKGLASFSRTSAARPSLGATSYAWMEAAERIEAESAVVALSSTTWPRRKKTALIEIKDLVWDYDRNLIKKARTVSFEGSVVLEQTEYLFQAIFDSIIKKYWGLRIMKVDPALQNQISLCFNEVIVKINGVELLEESRDKIFSMLIDEFAKPQVTMVALLKLDEFSPPLLSSDLLLPNGESPTSRRYSGRLTVSPASYIKNLNAFNTRSIGQMITIDLHKLAEGGFGISFATRDTLINTEEMQPVFVERIMPTGAAIHDGRLQFGDRLLSINEVQVTNFKDAMATLRSVPIGEKATLVFSRQDSVVVATPSTSPSIPIDPSVDRSSACAFNTTPDLFFDPPLCQTIIFEIPVPHRDSGTSSLGIRFEEWSEPRIIHAHSEFKGSEVIVDQMVGDTDDLEENLSGFFVKQISTGSPASKDLTSGSIKPGDRLVAVNGHSVIGLSLREISDKLKVAIGKAQNNMVGKNEQVFLKLTVNRFFHRSDKQSSCPKTKSILRPGSDSMFDKPAVQNDSNRETPIKKVNVLTARDKKDSLEIPSRWPTRTPSVDSRGRSRRERGSRSPSDSPVRCQSAFTRDGVGRRSVSEKRHAHISAASVVPFCNKGDEQASRLYSTMPASRKIRQIRRSKQGRPSGPIKPVHAEEAEKPQDATGTAASPISLLSFTQKRQTDDSDVLRTDAIDGPLATPSQLFRTRSHNHSFRSAVNSEYFNRSPPPTPPKPTKDWYLQNDPHRAVTPPLLARRSRVVPPTTDFRRMDSAPKLTNPSPSPSLDSPSSAAIIQQKAFEEIRQNLASELRKTPSPVDFNAYAVEQKEIHKISQPSRTKSFPNFLEEVETSLPKRRISRVNESMQVEEPSCSASDPAATFAQKNLLEPSSPVTLRDACSTVTTMVVRKSDVSNRSLSRQAFPISHCDSRNNDSSAWLPIPRSTVQAHIDSPHAIVRSRSPSSIHTNEARGGYSRPSASVPSHHHRRPSHSLTRPAKSSTKAQYPPSLKNLINFPEPPKREPYQVFVPSYSPTSVESDLTEGAQDNRVYLLNNQSQLPFHPLPSLKMNHPRSHTAPVLITTRAQSIRRCQISPNISTSANTSEFRHHFLPSPSFYPTFAFGRP
ncbi:hypothetical protein TcWFU_006109 [Taenia crassiceps]|uniref:PDZ domain-containing protein n=1 Tax=Taenia crassiceps TaxID=6207 RepID=A0ABR4QR39_9CEST